jgi:hypothetical protein
MIDLNMILIFVVVALGISIFFILKQGKLNKFNMTVRMLTGSKQVIVRTKGIERKDEKGVPKLFVKKFKEIIQMPPSNCIDIDTHGNFIVEAYRDRFGNYAYIEDKGIDRFRHPINTNQQIILADQIIKAHSKKTDWKQFLPMYVGLGMVTIVFVIFIFGVGEPLKALQTFTQSVAGDLKEYKTLQIQYVEEVKAMKDDIQIIKGNLAIPSNSQAPN